MVTFISFIQLIPMINSPIPKHLIQSNPSSSPPLHLPFTVPILFRNLNTFPPSSSTLFLLLNDLDHITLSSWSLSIQNKTPCPKPVLLRAIWGFRPAVWDVGDVAQKPRGRVAVPSERPLTGTSDVLNDLIHISRNILLVPVSCSCVSFRSMCRSQSSTTLCSRSFHHYHHQMCASLSPLYQDTLDLIPLTDWQRYECGVVHTEWHHLRKPGPVDRNKGITLKWMRTGRMGGEDGGRGVA